MSTETDLKEKELSKRDCTDRGSSVPGGVGYVDPVTPLGTAGKAGALNLAYIKAKTLDFRTSR